MVIVALLGLLMKKDTHVRRIYDCLIDDKGKNIKVRLPHSSGTIVSWFQKQISILQKQQIVTSATVGAFLVANLKLLATHRIAYCKKIDLACK